MFRPTVAIFRFPQPIKMSLYNLCEGMLMKRFVCINPLFALVSSVNCVYITNEEDDNPYLHTTDGKHLLIGYIYSIYTRYQSKQGIDAYRSLHQHALTQII
jgi:hypothetical protein